VATYPAPDTNESSPLVPPGAITVDSARPRLFVGTEGQVVRPVPPIAAETGLVREIVAVVVETPPGVPLILIPVPPVIEVTVPPEGLALDSHFVPSQIHVWYV